LSKDERNQMIRVDQTIPYTKKCQLLKISKSTVYYKSKQIEPDEEELALCLLLDELHMKHPWMGARRLRDQVNRCRVDYTVNRERIQRLIRKMGIHSVYAKPRTSIPGKGHKINPYLLRHLDICPNQVWSTDITYIPMAVALFT